MFATTRGTQVPARRWLLALISSIALVGGSLAGKADDGLVDVSRLPRLEGAVPREGQRDPTMSFSYFAPGTVMDFIATTGKLLAAEGWASYTPPLEQSDRNRWYKKGSQGLSAFFMTDGSRTDRSGVSYGSNRIHIDLPFPDGASDIVFDDNRPYLNCIAPGTVDANLDFFHRELIVAGWSPLSAPALEARWPNADASEKIENGVRAWYGHDDRREQKPIMVTLQRRADGRTGVEIKLAPFALPQELEAGKEIAGLPLPERTKGGGVSGGSDSIRRELKTAVAAEIPAVLAFYRRELGTRGWKEEAQGALVSADEVRLAFSSPEGNAALRLGRKYDLTIVQLVTQLSDAVVAARAKAKKEVDDKFIRDAQAEGRAFAAASEAKRIAEAAARGPEQPLRPLVANTAPVPLPDTAETIDFDGTAGHLKFDSASSVQAVAAFYRGVLKPMGWKEQHSVINNANMVVLEFARAGKDLSFTVMQMGPKTHISADGSDLVAAKETVKAASKAAEQNLEAMEGDGLPIPKGYTLSSPGSVKAPGGQIVRRDLNASIPAELGSVLAFYRRELTRRGWTETAEGAVVKPDNVMLGFSAPEGPAVLKLGRDKGETTVNLTQKIPAEAAKAGMLPAPGKVKLMFGNVGDAEAAITINNKTIKIAAGTGRPGTSEGPTLELPPGKYKYALKVGGRPARNAELEAGADDIWALMVSPKGDSVLPLQMY